MLQQMMTKETKRRRKERRNGGRFGEQLGCEKETKMMSVRKEGVFLEDHSEKHSCMGDEASLIKYIS